MSGRKQARVLMSGLVQGVFFRASAAYEAQKHGLTGFARNLADGRVEVLMEGEEASIYKMIDWCRYGPPSARVESVAVEWSDAKNQFDSFRCR